jgi:hypothetical protein
MSALWRRLKALFTSEEPTIWDLNDDEACDALERMAEYRSTRGGRLWDVDFCGSRMGRWDQALHIEAALAPGFPSIPRILVYFPSHKSRHKRLLRISGLRSTASLQRDIHARLQNSGELACKMMVYNVDQDALYRCLRHGLFVELRWAEAVASSLGQGADTTLRPACMFLSEQDGYSNTRAAFLLTSKAVQSDLDGFLYMTTTDEIKWVVGDRMTANARPEPAPRRQPKFQSRSQALYDIQNIGSRAAGALPQRDLFGSDDDGAEEEDSDGYTDRPGHSDSDVEEFGDSVFTNETGFNESLAESRRLDAVVTLDAREAVGKPHGVKALPLKTLTGDYVAYDPPGEAMAEKKALCAVAEEEGEEENPFNSSTD